MRTRFQVLYCFLSLYHSINQSVQTPTQTHQQSNVISCSQSFCTRGSNLAPAQGACLMPPVRSPECARAEVSRDRRRVAPPGPQGSQQSRLCWIHPQSQSPFRTDETLPVLKEAGMKRLRLLSPNANEVLVGWPGHRQACPPQRAASRSEMPPEVLFNIYTTGTTALLNTWLWNQGPGFSALWP